MADKEIVDCTDYSEQLQYVLRVADTDVKKLHHAEQSYGDSWKKRGGTGAMMMLARKWDRLENQVTKHNWDIFAAAQQDTRPEGIIDDIRDLRRYLLLVESELLIQGARHDDEPDLFIEDRCEWKTG
jgi:hypothetical protein